MRVLLLNPPGDKPYLRDYYCSHTAKSNYYWHPYDLVVQSGILSRSHDVEYLDANVYMMSWQDTTARIRAYNPEAVLFLTGGVSYKQDLAFIEQLNLPASVPIIGTGDVMVSKGRELMGKHPWLSGVLLDFTADAVETFFNAWDAQNATCLANESIPNLLFKKNGEFLKGVDPGKRYYSFPIPRYDLIPMNKYRIPHGRQRRFASFLTDFGCPYTCSFCFNGKWAHKLRDIDNAMQELRYLRQTGIKELWIKDLTFGVNRQHTTDFLNRLIQENLKFDWVTLSRVDVMDEEMLTLMSRAGCHTIQFGVESVDQDILNSIEKGIEPARVKEVFALCRRLGIRTLAHFILGLPGETEETARASIEYAKELDPDFVSFNVAAPRMGTDLRQEAIKEGWTSKDIDSIDNSTPFPQMNIGTLDSERVKELRNQAIREFHLRPSYLWRKATGWKTQVELWRSIQNGYGLLKSTISTPKSNETLEPEL